MKQASIASRLRRWGALGAVLWWSAAVAWADTVTVEYGEALEAVPAQQKLVRVRPARGSAEALRVAFKAERSRYRVGEAIRFKVKGNRPFYLYLFNIDPRSGEGLVILPNAIQGKKRILYPGDHRWHTVPNPELEFYSDRPGKERIVMVASTRYLDVDQMKRWTRSKRVGDWYYFEEPLKAVEKGLNLAYGGQAQEKRIRIRRSGTENASQLPPGVAVTEVALRILP